jgi:hypothetical protein
LPKKYLDNEINTYVGFLEFFCGVGVSIGSVLFMAHEVSLWVGGFLFAGVEVVLEQASFSGKKTLYLS